ncbi:MAG: ATP-binding protein [Planctomycetes bacterium]|nr:ATP-binding protein [Planctomycetota bacterium]
MSIASVRTGPTQKADRILLMGTEGVGKTSWAAAAPSPIFLCAEDGIPTALSWIPRLPEPESIEDVHAAIRSLAEEPHEFRTLVVDTIDWLEPVIWRDVAKKNGWKNKAGEWDIEAPGYGKGYIAANEEWRRILAGLDGLRRSRGMEIILLAHAAIKTFQNPNGPDYSRYECKLNKGAAALVKEWTDVNLFAIYEALSTETDIEKKGKAVSTGQRVVHTEWNAAWDAKNRHGLPPVLPLDYAAYAEARAKGAPASPDVLEADARELLKRWAPDEATASKAASEIEKAKGNAVRLAQLVNVLRTRISQKAA